MIRKKLVLASGECLGTFGPGSLGWILTILANVYTILTKTFTI